MIQIHVNGEQRSVPEGLRVIEVLENLGVDPARVAVELNRAIVRRPEWAERVVEPGAELEIVQFVGGG